MEDMLRVSFAVVQSLVAAKLGSSPDPASIADFLRAAVEDSAFPARAGGSSRRGPRPPSTARREMLARALFGIPASTPERDRVDAALERLFPEDVLLLRRLVELAPGSDMVYFGSPERGSAEEWGLYSLQAVGCVSFGAPPGAVDTWEDTARANISPLGHAVLKALQGDDRGGSEAEQVGEYRERQPPRRGALRGRRRLQGARGRRC